MKSFVLSSLGSSGSETVRKRMQSFVFVLDSLWQSGCVICGSYFMSDGYLF